MALSRPSDGNRNGRRTNPFASGSSAPAKVVVSSDTANELMDGIGILNFLEGRSYFITGATGLLGKAFVEKILRVAPSTRKIFLLVKAKDEEEALSRVKTEIIECGLFKKLEELHGENYRDFMVRKLVPVVGNMCEPNLGISSTELAARMAEEVDVIVNSAANTTLNERYDVALNLNTEGPSRLLSFAMNCKKLRLFLHVSTAYVNGERSGVVRERPFYMGQSIAEEMATASGTKQSSPFPKLDVHAEIKVASKMVQSFTKDEVDHKMKELGLLRAKMFGWQDTYVFTKAMGEMMVSSYKGHTPVTIIRPSIIESTYMEPFPGWIQGCRMVDPVPLSYGKGLLPGFFGDPQGSIDIVPVDIVVNAMVSAMGKHGAQRDLELNVYHVSTSVINPLRLHEMFGFSFDHFVSSPLRDPRGNEIGIGRMNYFSSLDKFSAYVRDEVEERVGLRGRAAASDPEISRKLRETCKRTVQSFTRKARMYEPYTFYKGWFHNENTQKLMAEMSEDELRTFPLDLRGIDWKKYFVNIHLPGLRGHVLKDGRAISNL